MKILIYQVGENLGPFTETQVRQYLDAGLISPMDFAIREGMDSWQSLDSILAHLPPATDEFGTILPDVPPRKSSTPEGPAPESKSSSNMQNDSPETLEPRSVPPPPESAPSPSATQRAKRKLNKIVIQPMLPLEPTTSAAARKKGRTGKTALTLEPLRPTTALPPVTGFGPKSRRTGKTSLKTGAVPLRDLPEKAVQANPTPASLMAPPPPAEAQPAPSPKPLLPPVSLLPEKTKKNVGAKTFFPRISHLFIYAGAMAAFLVTGVTISFAYLIVAHFATPPNANPENAPPPPEHVQAQSQPAAPVTATDYSDRGFLRQSNSDFDGAIADYNKAVELDPKNSETFYRRGLALQGKGDLNGAVADYNTVLSLDSRNANAFSNRGFIKQSQGDVDAALADYTQALLINPKIARVYYNQGLIEVQKGYLDSAIANFNHALDLDPKMAFAYYNRGAAKNTEGDLDGAISDLTQALLLSPGIARAYGERGSARQAKGDLDGALADYSQALSLDPSLAVIYFKRSGVNIQKGDLAAAVSDSTKAIDLDPKNDQAYFNRGLAQFGKGKLDDARADLNQFCESAPREVSADTARIYLWLISTEQNPRDNADQQLSTSLLNDWNSPPEDMSSKIASFLLGHISESEFIDDGASPDPSREPAQYCKVWYFAGMKRLLAGDMKTAISYFQKCLTTNQATLCENAFAQAELQALGQSREVASKPEASQ